MRRLVLEHQHERFVAVAPFLEPGERLVGDDVGGVTGVRSGDRLGRHRRR